MAVVQRVEGAGKNRAEPPNRHMGAQAQNDVGVASNRRGLGCESGRLGDSERKGQHVQARLFNQPLLGATRALAPTHGRPQPSLILCARAPRRPPRVRHCTSSFEQSRRPGTPNALDARRSLDGRWQAMR